MRDDEHKRDVVRLLRRVVRTGETESLPCGCVVRTGTEAGKVSVSMCAFHKRRIPLDWVAQMDVGKAKEGAHRRLSTD